MARFLEVADDLVVILSDDRGKRRLAAASLCGLSDWHREQKLGTTMAEVLSPIPYLTHEISDQIDSFSSRLPNESLMQRIIWSLKPHPDLMSRDEWQVGYASK